MPLVLERVREAGPSWTELEGPAAAGGVARVTRRGGGCGVTGALVHCTSAADGTFGCLSLTRKCMLGVVLQISNFDRNIARNKVQLERNKVFKIKSGCKRIID